MTTTRARTVQQPRVAGLVDTRYDVIVDGTKVGEVVKNKHRIWWGHFDPNVTVAAPPFVDGVRSPEPDIDFKVHPSRRKADVVAAVVRAEYGVYATELRAQTAKWDDAYAAKVAAELGEDQSDPEDEVSEADGERQWTAYWTPQ
jgi:hypothetical protein